MKDEARKYLHDIKGAAAAIRDFVAGKTYEDYCADEMLRSAVERKFEIIGEALSRIKQAAPDVLDAIREHRSIISFRNILAHGYDTIDDRIVWGVIEENLPDLLNDVEALARDEE